MSSLKALAMPWGEAPLTTEGTPFLPFRRLASRQKYLDPSDKRISHWIQPLIFLRTNKIFHLIVVKPARLTHDISNITIARPTISHPHSVPEDTLGFSIGIICSPSCNSPVTMRVTNRWNVQSWWRHTATDYVIVVLIQINWRDIKSWQLTGGKTSRDILLIKC